MKLVRLKLQNGEVAYVNQDVIIAVGQAFKDDVMVIGVSVIQTVSGTQFAVGRPPKEVAELVSDSIIGDADEDAEPTTLDAIHRG